MSTVGRVVLDEDNTVISDSLVVVFSSELENIDVLNFLILLVLFSINVLLDFALFHVFEELSH